MTNIFEFLIKIIILIKIKVFFDDDHSSHLPHTSLIQAIILNENNILSHFYIIGQKIVDNYNFQVV